MDMLGMGANMLGVPSSVAEVAIPSEWQTLAGGVLPPLPTGISDITSFANVPGMPNPMQVLGDPSKILGANPLQSLGVNPNIPADFQGFQTGNIIAHG